jgi:hypothetical protein
MGAPRANGANVAVASVVTRDGLSSDGELGDEVPAAPITVLSGDRADVQPHFARRYG